MATPTVIVLFEAKVELGEAPFYDPKANELIWVDIDGMSINFTSLSSNTNRKLQMKEKPSIAIPCRSGKGLLVTLGRKLCIIDRNTGKCSVTTCCNNYFLHIKSAFFYPGDVLKELFSVEPEKEGNRFNDCKCDRLGRFWGGTMCPPTSYQPPFPTEGSLYSFDGSKTSTA